MTTKTIDFACELKATGDTGTFEGYGSVFNVTDFGGDIVVPGAFKDSLEEHKAAGRMPAMLWQHNQREPIGVYTHMEEDGTGLKVRGQLAMKTARGAEAFELMKMGALNGLSIGYSVRKSDDASYDRDTGIRTIKRAKLYEVSPVTFPMNDAARISTVKSIEEMESLADIERHLRDAGGFSRSEALALVSRIKSVIGRGDPGEDADLQLAQRAAEAALRAISKR